MGKNGENGRAKIRMKIEGENSRKSHYLTILYVDRSLLGDRDSEIAVMIEDEALVPSKMGGQPYMASKFALSLRLDLWREHLGLSTDTVNTVLVVSSPPFIPSPSSFPLLQSCLVKEK